MELAKLKLGNTLKTGERGHFPRPDLVRNPSFSLDGEWLLCPDRKATGRFKGWQNRDFGLRALRGGTSALAEDSSFHRVRVPFPLESEINQRQLARHGLGPEVIASHRAFWYYRYFKRPAELTAGVIKFGAVDYRASVWLNGVFLGEHEGGYTPFEFVVERFEEENILTVLVEDSRSMGQVRGKQTFLKKPFMVWYPGCTGIWQPVWIEPLGRVYCEALVCRRDDRGGVVISFDVRSARGVHPGNVDVSLRLYASQVHDGGRGILRTPLREFREFVALDAMGRGHVDIAVPEKLLSKWSVDWPGMHPVEIGLRQGKKEIDTLYLLYGSRQIGVESGIIKLNRKKLYQKLLLNQGYYGDGQYSPESPDQFRTDIELMKKAGFNGCRVHQKIEHPAFLYWADLLGFLVWEEMPSYYRPSAGSMVKLERELSETMRRDAFHPSIITIVLFNESWGIYNAFVSKKARNDVVDLFERCRRSYPGYLVIDNSGFHHLKTDITDIHHYIPTLEETEQFYALLVKGVREAPLWYNFIRMILGKENAQTPFLRGYGETASPLIVSEFGGYGFGMYKHQEMPLDDFLKKHIEVLSRFPAIQGLCYTQFADTFQEKNGLFTEDRQLKSRKVREYLAKLLPR